VQTPNLFRFEVFFFSKLLNSSFLSAQGIKNIKKGFYFSTMARLTFLSAAFLAFATTNAQGLLQARNPYYGGFALPGTPEDGAVHGCPSGTLTCSNQVFTFCCPNFTFCGPFQLGPYCCPTCKSCAAPFDLFVVGRLTCSA